MFQTYIEGSFMLCGKDLIIVNVFYYLCIVYDVWGRGGNDSMMLLVSTLALFFFFRLLEK